jgi:hypothetical protein
MSATHEQRIHDLAHRVGLELARISTSEDCASWRLVEPISKRPVYPGGIHEGTELAELEDWLRFPWE